MNINNFAVVELPKKLNVHREFRCQCIQFWRNFEKLKLSTHGIGTNTPIPES